METMLGDAITAKIIRASFRDKLNKWIRRKMGPFSDLPHEEYVRKAEVTDQHAQEQKIGPYSPRKEKKRAETKTPSSKNGKNGQGNGGRNGNGKSLGKDSKKTGMSKVDLRKKGLCFKYEGARHPASDCSKPRRDGKEKETKGKVTSPESNSIRVFEEMEARMKEKRRLYDQKRD
jgi:hypothetical protein